MQFGGQRGGVQFFRIDFVDGIPVCRRTCFYGREQIIVFLRHDFNRRYAGIDFVIQRHHAVSERTCLFAGFSECITGALILLFQPFQFVSLLSCGIGGIIKIVAKENHCGGKRGERGTHAHNQADAGNCRCKSGHQWNGNFRYRDIPGNCRRHSAYSNGNSGNSFDYFRIGLQKSVNLRHHIRARAVNVFENGGKLFSNRGFKSFRGGIHQRKLSVHGVQLDRGHTVGRAVAVVDSR